MNQTQKKIKELLNLSSNVRFSAQCITGEARLLTKQDCDLLNDFDDGKVFGVEYKNESGSYSYSIDDVVKYRISINFSEHEFASYENFIFHQFDLKNVDKVLPDNHIVYEDWYRTEKQKQTSILKDLVLFSKFIKCLAKKYYHTNNKIIFFSKRPCELFIGTSTTVSEKFIKLATGYDTKLSKHLVKMIEWLSEEVVSNDNGIQTTVTTHQNERYAIASTEFVDCLITCDEKDRIFTLLRNIDSVYQCCLSKHSLYLEDFKYSKFIDKITKHSEEFLTKVNKTISDIQAQILAVPLAASVITVFKTTDKVNTYIYIAFIVYLIMVLYACCQQAYNLVHTENQVKKFDKEAKLPTELSKTWDSEIEPVNKKIYWHKIYLLLVSLGIAVLIFICLFNIFT